MGNWAGKLAGALLICGVVPAFGNTVEKPSPLRAPAAQPAASPANPATKAPKPADQDSAPAKYPASAYVIRSDHWTDNDEREYGQFVFEIGDSGCNTVNKCLHDLRNPFRGTDPPGTVFGSDCADLPYVLRFYYAWKRGLPFSFESEVEPRGHSHDIRYTAAGNRPVAREFPVGQNGYEVLQRIQDAVSSATYRIHPELETPVEQDFYSPAITEKSIRPGTVVYDPNGHLITVWKVERDGRVHYIDAHPDHAVTRGYYDARFVRSSPGMGAGFKNWRPQVLVGAKKQPDGTWRGGEIQLAANKDIADYSVEQFFGNGQRPASDRDWKDGSFTLNNETVDYYDYVRGQLAGGTLSFDPLREVGDMVDSNCADLHYRGDAVDLAIAAGIHKREQPDRLPPNIYGTDGDWETYSSPSRDARLKTAFKELYGNARRFVDMAAHNDSKLNYKGKNLAADMLAVYDAHAAQCQITYARSNGAKASFGYEEARRRLFDMSFDPYHCPERRWGAHGEELATCPDNALKAAWYEAEKNLRNQIDRTYDARMDFGLAELKTPGPGKGVPTAPETDVRSWLASQPGVQAWLKSRQKPAPATKAANKQKPWWWLF